MDDGSSGVTLYGLGQFIGYPMLHSRFDCVWSAGGLHDNPTPHVEHARRRFVSRRTTP